MTEDNLLLEFDRLVVIYNPISTNARRSRKRIAELKDLFPSKEVIVVETSPGGLEANKKLVAREAAKFNGRTLLCIAAGDGTVSAVLDGLLGAKSLPKKAKMVPLLPLWGGNANDLAYMINGRPSRINLKDVFEKGRVVPIYPLNVKLVIDGKATQKIAGCYVSFGASAYTARQADMPKNRKKKIYIVPGARMLTEMYIVAKSMLKAKTFTITVGGKTEPVYERIFVNGSRIAKVDRLPVRLNEKAFYEATLSHKHPQALLSLLSALKFFKNRTYGEVTEKDIKFKLNEDTWSQIDGEVMRLRKDTEVEISLSQTPFYVLSTKLG